MKWMLLLLSACGAQSEVEAQIVSEVSLSAVKSVEFALLDGHDASGAVTCAADASTWFEHAVIYHEVVAPNALKLANVPVGSGFVVVVVAYATSDGSGAPIGSACVQNVNVTAGGNTKLNIVLTAP